MPPCPLRNQVWQQGDSLSLLARDELRGEKYCWEVNNVDGFPSKFQALTHLDIEAPGDSWGPHLFSTWVAPLSSNQAVLSYIGWGAQSEKHPLPRGIQRNRAQHGLL